MYILERLDSRPISLTYVVGLDSSHNVCANLGERSENFVAEEVVRMRKANVFKPATVKWAPPIANLPR